MSANGRLALVIEDEPQVIRFLRASLAGHGFKILDAPTGQRGLIEASAHVPDIVLLDLALPDMDGVEVMRRLREWTSVPVIVLSARGQERDKIEALDAGADDYLTKPFGIGELLARMRVALRHADRVGEDAESGELVVGDLSVNLAARRVTVADKEVHLTPNEYRLLAVLARNAGKVVTQRQLLKEVWGPSSIEQSHYLRVYMAQLRHKLEPEPARPRWLITEPGVGYRLRTD
jgi:two-component system, OmpR family, KDP operon response regulator KdpE